MRATSSENERTFSDARLIISDNRMRLGPDVSEGARVSSPLGKRRTVRES